MTTMATPNAAPPAETPAARSVRTWSIGDYGRIAAGFTPGAADFVRRRAIARDERVLDVACGTGNLTLPAARAGAIVTGIDIAPPLVEQAQRAADAQALRVQLDGGDCTAMPYATDSFDTVLSMFGAMFAAPAQAAADEMLRVIRPGGRIVMANWTPEGFIGDMLRTLVSRRPPAPGTPSPIDWGREPVVRERFALASRVTTTRRMMPLAYAMPPEEAATLFRTAYGPAVLAFAALDAHEANELRLEFESLWRARNMGTWGATYVEGEYLEVVVEK